MPNHHFKLAPKNVLALYGGMSAEHDISLLSADYLMSVLRKRHNVIAVHISKTGEWKTSDGFPCFIIPDRKDGGLFVVKGNEQIKAPVDVAFPVFHGQNGEDGTLQGLLEFAGIPYVGCDVSSSALCYDKALTKIHVKETGVRQAEYFCCSSSDLRKNMGSLISRVEQDFGYPCFVKPAHSGSSLGISRPKDRSELVEALYNAAGYDQKILIEKAVYGRELECALLGNDSPETSLIGEILTDDGYYDYDSKYRSSKINTIIPEDLDEAKVREIQQAAIAIYKACGCSGLSRADFFLEAKTNDVVFNEINTFPGFTPISMYPKLWEASGLHIETLCDLLMHFALERWGRLASHTNVFVRKKNGVPWNADEFAAFLGGAWAVPPPEAWSASYIAYSGSGSAVSKEPPVLIVTPQYPNYPKNAKAYVIDKKQGIKNTDIPVLVTFDSEAAMMKLAKFGRKSMTGKIVAITGSVGKTSTKDMLSDLLKTFGTCVHTFGSQNTLTGIRSILASLIANPDYSVVEVCSHILNARNRETVDLIRPDIAVITQVSLAHADELGFKNEADVAICKSRIAENIRYGGVCLINHEINEFDLVKKTVEAYGARPVSYGINNKSDVWVIEAGESDHGFAITANIFGNEVRYQIPYLGLGFALNSVAVLAAVHLLNEDVPEAAKRLADTPLPKHRLSLHTINVKGGQAKLIDDCYNAQPLAVVNALSTLKLIRPIPGGRKVAILGDIRTFSGEFMGEYKTLVKPILESADLVYLVGKDIMTLKDALPAKFIAGEFPDIDAAAKALPDLIRPDDTVLVKVTSAGSAKSNLALKLLDAVK